MDRRPASGGEGEARRAGGGGATCLRRLQGQQSAVRRALGGRSLRVRIDRPDAGATLAVMFTRDGNVVQVPPDQPFEPHVELRGTADAVHAFLAGDTDLLDAVLARLVVLHIPESDVPHYRPLRDLVAGELRPD